MMLFLMIVRSDQYGWMNTRKGQGRPIVTWRTLEELTQRAQLHGLEPNQLKKYSRRVRTKCHACYMKRNGWQCHVCLTSSGQVTGMATCCPQLQIALISSPWMPLLRGSLKMTSLPGEMWLPCSVLARFIWTVPTSWLPTKTLTRLIWTPFLPSWRRGWGSPGPGWLVPSRCVRLLLFTVHSLLLRGFFLCFQLCERPSTVIVEEQRTNSQNNRKVPR